jgi:23S rRNA pseudouridine955/2504/2580 synthase
MTNVFLLNFSDKDAVNIRLDRWLRERFPGISFGRLQKILRTGQIRVDGKRCRGDLRLELGMQIRLPPIFSAKEASVAEKTEAKNNRNFSAAPAELIEQLRGLIIYQDASILVLNKPAGLAVQGGSGIKYSLDKILPALVASGEVTPRLVHRLDKETSGVLLVALTRQAAQWYASAFKEQRAKKTYWALVAPIPMPLSGTIDRPISKNKQEDGSDRIEEDERGSKATTFYEVLDSNQEQVAWVELKPVTGRMHQLRVHMAAIGCPIIGDSKYGLWNQDDLPSSKILHLHARNLKVENMEGKMLSFSAPLGEKLADSWKSFGFKTKKK